MLRDLAAHFPQLVFEADWIRELIRSTSTTADFSKDGPRSQIFRALANGFRAAAKPTARAKTNTPCVLH